MKLLELAQVAYKLYVSRPPHERRPLVDVVLSNCRLRDGTLEYDLRKPFDLLVDVQDVEIWRGRVDEYRTLCLASSAGARSAIEAVLRIAV